MKKIIVTVIILSGIIVHSFSQNPGKPKLDKTGPQHQEAIKTNHTGPKPSKATIINQPNPKSTSKGQKAMKIRAKKKNFKRRKRVAPSASTVRSHANQPNKKSTGKQSPSKN